MTAISLETDSQPSNGSSPRQTTREEELKVVLEKCKNTPKIEDRLQPLFKIYYWFGSSGIVYSLNVLIIQEDDDEKDSDSIIFARYGGPKIVIDCMSIRPSTKGTQSLYISHGFH